MNDAFKAVISSVIVKTQAQEIKQKKKELKIVGKELVERRAKARKISRTNSNSAKKPRSCPEVNELSILDQTIPPPLGLHFLRSFFSFTRVILIFKF